MSEREFAGKVAIVTGATRGIGKAIWPGRKQVWRWFDGEGRIARDLLTLEDDEQDGEKLIEPVMREGRRLKPSPSLDDVRKHAAGQLETLPEPLRRLDGPAGIEVEVSQKLRDLAEEVDRRNR